MTKQELRALPLDFSKAEAPEINLEGIKMLLAYHSLKSEVNIDRIIAKAKSMGIKIVYATDDPYCFDGVNIREITCPALILVPGFFFTEDGKRLGRGKGFYDKTLSVLPSCVKSIGICKKSRILPDLPTEEHDMCVSEVLIC